MNLRSLVRRSVPLVVVLGLGGCKDYSCLDTASCPTDIGEAGLTDSTGSDPGTTGQTTLVSPSTDENAPPFGMGPAPTVHSSPNSESTPPPHLDSGDGGGVSSMCDQCSAGQTSCEDGRITTCVLESGCWIWSVAQPCPEGLCKDAVACTTCTDVCTVGAATCSDGSLQTCAGGPEGCSTWLAPVACSTGACADDGACFECDDQCTFGEARCINGELAHCEEDALGCLDWGAAEPCTTGECTTSSACGECDDTCSIGQKRCQDGVFSQCVADSNGCLDWSESDCASGTCSSNTECLVCNNECASAGQGNCEGKVLQTCTADANGCLAWSEPTTCQYVCDSGTNSCSGECTPGQRRCDDQQPQECDDDGEWQDWGPECAGCMACSGASASCVATTGAMCNDDNACTTGERCQSNGNCGGGNAVTCSGADECHTVGACQPDTGCPAPVVKNSSCDDENPCITGESCQANGSCGGGTAAGNTVSCGNNKYCDGSGGCACRTKSSWNLLSNPGFNGSANSWTLVGGASYQTEDVDSCNGSGSALIAGLAHRVEQCVPALPSTDYFFGFRFKASGGADSVGTAICNIFFLTSGTPCDGGYDGSGSASQAYNTNTWIQGSTMVTTQSNTATIRVNCVGAAAAGYYDQLYLSRTSPGVPAF